MSKKNSKRFKNLLEIKKNKKIENLDNTISLIKKNCTAKFDESIDVSFTLKLKQKKKRKLTYVH